MNLTLKLTGLTPLLTHRGGMADPLDRYARRIKELPRRKTDEVIEEMARIEWEGGMNLDPQGRPCILGQQVWRSIQEGARLTKDGKAVERGVGIAPDSLMVPIEHDGPRDLDAMWADPQYRNRAIVRVGQQRVARTRPQWAKWAATVTFTVHASLISPDDVVRFAYTAGEVIGVGDGRGIGYGRYTVEVI